MNRIVFLAGLVLALVSPVMAVTDPFVRFEPKATENTYGSDWCNEFLANRLEIGFRMTYFSLTDPKKDSGFLGSINELEEDQVSTPYPYLRYYFTKYVGLEVGYDQLRAITRKSTTAPADFPDYKKSKDSDGALNLEGPVLELLARYPNSSRFTPYAGAGVIFYSAEFEMESWWHNGFQAYFDPDYQTWVEEGKPEWPNGGYRRTITLSDTTAYLVSGGCAVKIWRGIEIDAEVRYVQADADAHYTLSHYGNIDPNGDFGTFNFPLDNTAYQMSLKYSF
jgi:opacity protein-like surface antigen